MKVCIFPFDCNAEMLVMFSKTHLAFTARMFLFCSMIFAATTSVLERSAYVSSVGKITWVVNAVETFSESLCE